MEFKVMNRNGDDRFTFDEQNSTAVDAAMAKFAELVGGGKMLAYTPGKDGVPAQQIKSLDRDNLPESVVFAPQLIGG